MKNIAVIGAGTMGNGIAHIFAQNEFKVNLIDLNDSSLDRGIATIAKNLDRLIAKEKITKQIKINTLENIEKHTNLKSGLANADFVIEAITENLDIKLDVFRNMDKYSPKHAILATNTSSISITKIASITTRAEKVIGMHFMNPVPIMKLVEVIRGYSTTQQVTNSVMELAEKLGKVPVEVTDYPGFIANRILMPMLNEAFYSLYEGVAGVRQIDKVMKLGLSHPMGPLELADFIGLDVCLYILKVLHDGFGNPKYAPCPLLINMVNARELGVKSGIGFYDYTESKKAQKISPQFA